MNDPIAEWNRRIDEKTARGMSKKRAVQTLVHEDPELQKAYLIAHNLEAGRPAAVAMRYGPPR